MTSLADMAGRGEAEAPHARATAAQLQDSLKVTHLSECKPRLKSESSLHSEKLLYIPKGGWNCALIWRSCLWNRKCWCMAPSSGLTSPSLLLTGPAAAHAGGDDSGSV